MAGRGFVLIVPPLHVMSNAPDHPRIGLYGGSFDPVHAGHLILARDAVEQLGLARMIFLPAAISPHKLGRAPGASGVDRADMLRAAVEGEARFEVDARELARSGPSYTVDTVREVAGLFPGARFFYLIGEDNVPLLHTWHRAELLREMVQFVVCRRHSPATGTGAAEREAENGWPVVERWVDISSTEIRMRVATGGSIRYLVPEGVREIIAARSLYRSTDKPEETSH